MEQKRVPTGPTPTTISSWLDGRVMFNLQFTLERYTLVCFEAVFMPPSLRKRTRPKHVVLANSFDHQEWSHFEDIGNVPSWESWKMAGKLLENPTVP